MGVLKQPPAPLDETPPDERPDGDDIWISGYWAFDEDRDDFIWVSGLWRTAPPGRQWIGGYWRENAQEWQWVPGFWTAAKGEQQQMTYLPEPPKLDKVAPPGPKPTEDSFYVPPLWMWNGSDYALRPGYWSRIQPGWVWVPDHYRWSPGGYVFVAGYWDLAVSKRGILYAPVYVSPTVRVSYTYTPAYAVRDTVVVDTLFVQPATCHYYFGDYYETRYRDSGYVSCVAYSETRYDSIVVYERYERRSDPTWFSVQINLYNDRCAGRQPVPPRVINQTVIQQNVVQQNIVQQNIVQQNVVQQNVVQQNVTNVNNTTVNNTNVNNTNVNNTNVNNTRNVNNNLAAVAPTKAVVQSKNMSVVKVDDTTRQQAKQQAQALNAVSKNRGATESSGPPAKGQVKTAAMTVPKAQPVKQGMVAPKPPPTTAKIGSPATSSPAVKSGPAASSPAVKSAQAASSPAVKSGQPASSPITKPLTPASATGQQKPLTQTSAVGTSPQAKPPVTQQKTPSNTPWVASPPSNNRPGQQPVAGQPAVKGPTTGFQPAAQPKTTTPPKTPQRTPPPPPKDKDKKKDKDKR
jgi:hypothetical protein